MMQNVHNQIFMVMTLYKLLGSLPPEGNSELKDEVLPLETKSKSASEKRIALGREVLYFPVTYFYDFMNVMKY